MKPATKFLGVVAVMLFAIAAFAAPVPRAVVSGTSPQTYTAAADLRLVVQCPNQVISFRPMMPTDVHDAGISDVRMDFTATGSPDPYPINLNSVQTRINFQNIDGGAILCNLANNW